MDMSEYRHGAHGVFAIHLRLVRITKYRKPKNALSALPLSHRAGYRLGAQLKLKKFEKTQGEVSFSKIPLLPR